MIQTKFTKLIGCGVPIQLAGMPGINTVELTAAVCNSGGLGMISGTHMSPDYLSGIIDDLRKQTSLPFGVNFLMPFIDRDTVLTAASGSKLVEFFYGKPDPLLIDLVHYEGALACWQIGSVNEAVMAEKSGCDLIVVQGVEAGGHVRGDTELLTLLSEVLNSVTIPTVAAGGIGSAQDVADVIDAGASAVRIGTRFLAAKESGAHPKYIEAVLNADAKDTVLTETFSVGWAHAHHRVLKSCLVEVNSFKDEIVGERDLAGVKNPIPRGSIALPTKETTGYIEAMALYASRAVGAIAEAQSANEIIDELTGKLR